MTITIAGRVVRPPRRIWMLCQHLAASPEQVFSRAQIMDAIDMGEDCSDRAIDSIVRDARKIDGLRPHIRTRAGLGYYWQD